MPWDEGLINRLVYEAPNPAEGRVLSYPRAINEALAIALEHDSSVFVLGQGADDPSTMFGTTRVCRRDSVRSASLTSRCRRKE